MTLDEALELRKQKRLVFTNGVFDILHAGHVQYLSAARELGDLLIVALNTDDSVRRLGKGPDRPVNSLEDRAAVVSALRDVDAVISFDEDTPSNVIAVLKPEVHVKGGDYQAELLPESEVIESYGGHIVILPTLEGRSTTSILRKLEEK